MPIGSDYLEKAAEALVQLAEATTEAERVRLRRSHGAYIQLSKHAAQAAERAAISPAPKIKAEKPTAAAAARDAPRYFGGVN
jgi:LDH2 family malate/lactate/ureidoglycolate dehydrogenase